MTADRTVLFVCVGNAGRSVLAEALFNRFGPPGWHAVSAGVAPARATNPLTGAALAAIGVPLPAHSPHRLTEAMVREAAVRVSLGAIDHPACPAWFAETNPRRWDLPDPQHFDAQGFEEIRDAIRARVDELAEELRSGGPPAPSFLVADHAGPSVARARRPAPPGSVGSLARRAPPGTSTHCGSPSATPLDSDSGRGEPPGAGGSSRWPLD